MRQLLLAVTAVMAVGSSCGLQAETSSEPAELGATSQAVRTAVQADPPKAIVRAPKQVDPTPFTPRVTPGADDGRCPGWSRSVTELACQALRTGRVVKASRQGLKWRVTLPYAHRATLVEVELPEQPIRSAVGIGLEVTLVGGAPEALGQSAAVFTVDSDFTAVDVDQLGERGKAAIDLGTCGGLLGGWALEANESARGDSWSVFFAPPLALSERAQRLPWGSRKRFVVVNEAPKCQAALDLRANLRAASPDGEPHDCGGGTR